MKSPIAALLALAALVSPCSAQAADLPAREAALVQQATTGLHAVADALTAQKQHARALELRREIWFEYAPEDKKARELTGFVRVGDLWRVDDSRLVPDRDLAGDKRAMKKIDDQWAALVKALLAEHRALASAYGAEANARWHWRRVLRFAPGDKPAAEALALAEFEGFPGTPDELVLLRRGRAIRGACNWLNRAEIAVAEVKGEPNPLLQQCKIEHTTVRSRHFSVWGTLPLSELLTIAADCERALLLSRRLFYGVGGEVFAPRLHRNLIFLHDQPSYAAVLDACRDQFDAARLQFLKNDVQLTFLSHDKVSLRVYYAAHGLEAQRDQAVRGVVQDAAGILSDSMSEGIGHAACGFLFDRTLSFRTEQLRDRTSSDWKPRTLAPDMATWKLIAAESAWAKSDSRTSELRLMSAARFSNEQRVKAWAICHWFALMDPALILELEACKGEKIVTAVDVEGEFLRRTGRGLPQLDQDWREFWGKSMLLRAAIERDPLPPDAAAAAPGASAVPTLAMKQKPGERAAVVRAQSLVDAVCAARADANIAPVGFYLSTSPDGRLLADYTKQLIKYEADLAKKPKQPPTAPTLPAAVGRTVLWSREVQPAAAVAAWWQMPAWRDLMLHPGRELLAATGDASHWCLDLSMPVVATRTGLPVPWPGQGQQGVPGEVSLDQLGPRARAAFAAVGKQGAIAVGMPLSLHFARDLDAAARAAVRCRVYCNENPVNCVRVDYGVAGDDGDHAPGCIAVVPLQPLPAGGNLELRWELPEGLLGKDAVYPPVRCRVR